MRTPYRQAITKVVDFFAKPPELWRYCLISDSAGATVVVDLVAFDGQTVASGVSLTITSSTQTMYDLVGSTVWAALSPPSIGCEVVSVKGNVWYNTAAAPDNTVVVANRPSSASKRVKPGMKWGRVSGNQTVEDSTFVQLAQGAVVTCDAVTPVKLTPTSPTASRRSVRICNHSGQLLNIYFVPVNAIAQGATSTWTVADIVAGAKCDYVLSDKQTLVEPLGANLDAVGVLSTGSGKVWVVEIL